MLKAAKSILFLVALVIGMAFLFVRFYEGEVVAARFDDPGTAIEGAVRMAREATTVPLVRWIVCDGQGREKVVAGFPAGAILADDPLGVYVRLHVDRRGQFRAKLGGDVTAMACRPLDRSLD